MEDVTYSREAAGITLGRMKSWDELNANNTEKADTIFIQKTKELWNNITVHGAWEYAKDKGERVLKAHSDLDGESALALLKMSGIKIDKLNYVPPGKSLAGTINIDTGGKFGVVYDEAIDTAWFDHHESGHDEQTSATEVVYKALTSLDILKKTPTLDRLVSFVTMSDNRNYPPNEYWKGARTILGLRKSITWENLLKYFESHETGKELLTDDDLVKYNLVMESRRLEQEISETRKALDKLVAEGHTINTKYGKILINEGNVLRHPSAAYTEFNGVLSVTPGKSFALTLYEGEIDEEKLRTILGKKFQGVIIRKRMWLYTEPEELLLTTEEIVKAIKT